MKKKVLTKKKKGLGLSTNQSSSQVGLAEGNINGLTLSQSGLLETSLVDSVLDEEAGDNLDLERGATARSRSISKGQKTNRGLETGRDGSAVSTKTLQTHQGSILLKSHIQGDKANYYLSLEGVLKFLYNFSIVDKYIKRKTLALILNGFKDYVDFKGFLKIMRLIAEEMYFDYPAINQTSRLLKLLQKLDLQNILNVSFLNRRQANLFTTL